MRVVLVAIGIFLATPTARAGQKQRFFLTHPGGMAGDKAADVYLSSYRLNHPALKRLAARGKLSPRRWVEIEDPVIYPGHGEGTATIDGMKFRVTYAWKGLSEWDAGIGEKNFHTVLGWTVRIEGTEGAELAQQMARIREGILKDENGGRVTKDIPLAKYLASMGVKTLPELRAKWIRDHKEAVKYLSESTDPKMVEVAKAMAASGTAGIDRSIAELKAKKSVEVPVRMRTIEPWTLSTRRARPRAQASE